MPEPSDELILELTGVSPRGIPEPGVGRPLDAPIANLSATKDRIARKLAP